jgi:hypothetical protein
MRVNIDDSDVLCGTELHHPRDELELHLPIRTLITRRRLQNMLAEGLAWMALGRSFRGRTSVTPERVIVRPSRRSTTQKLNNLLQKYHAVRDRKSRQFLSRWLKLGGGSELLPPDDLEGWKAVWMIQKGCPCLAISFPTQHERRFELIEEDDHAIRNVKDLHRRLASRRANFCWDDDEAYQLGWLKGIVKDADCVLSYPSADEERQTRPR